MKTPVFIMAMALPFFIKGAMAQNIQKKPMKISITSEDLKLEATLNKTSTAQDLLKKLPLTLNFYQHQAREYYTNIHLEKNDATQQEYQIGDIAYWTPGDSLVVFYDKGYTGNLIIIGKVISGLDRLSKMKASFKAQISYF